MITSRAKRLHGPSMRIRTLLDEREKPGAALPVASKRRAFLAQMCALAAAGYAQAHPFLAYAQSLRLDTGGPLLRRALVRGNTAYQPERQSIPSSRKNAADVADARAALGFEVRREIDQSTPAMRNLIRDFVSGLRSDGASRALAVFCYTGHGSQVRGENFMLCSAGALDQRAEGIARAAINIDHDIIAQASLPNDGTSVLIFDACRNDPDRVKTDAAATFNQVNPPRGTVITFSTAPG